MAREPTLLASPSLIPPATFGDRASAIPPALAPSSDLSLLTIESFDNFTSLLEEHLDSLPAEPKPTVLSLENKEVFYKKLELIIKKSVSNNSVEALRIQALKDYQAAARNFDKAVEKFDKVTNPTIGEKFDQFKEDITELRRDLGESLSPISELADGGLISFFSLNSSNPLVRMFNGITSLFGLKKQEKTSEEQAADNLNDAARELDDAAEVLRETTIITSGQITSETTEEVVTFPESINPVTATSETADIVLGPKDYTVTDVPPVSKPPLTALPAPVDYENQPSSVSESPLLAGSLAAEEVVTFPEPINPVTTTSETADLVLDPEDYMVSNAAPASESPLLAGSLAADESNAFEDPNMKLAAEANQEVVSTFGDPKAAPFTDAIGDEMDEAVNGNDDKKAKAFKVDPLLMIAITAISVAVTAISPAINALGESILKIVTFLVNDLGPDFKKLLSTIVDTVCVVLETIKPIIVTIGSFFTAALEKVFGLLLTFLSDPVGTFTTVMVEVIPKLMLAVLSTFETLIDLLVMKIGDFFLDLFTKLDIFGTGKKAAAAKADFDNTIYTRISERNLKLTDPNSPMNAALEGRYVNGRVYATKAQAIAVTHSTPVAEVESYKPEAQSIRGNQTIVNNYNTSVSGAAVDSVSAASAR